MEDFLTFRKMITPIIIQIVFWIGVAAVIIFGLIALVGSRGNISAIVGGLIMILLGPIFVRVYCEVVIIFFRIEENTRRG